MPSIGIDERPLAPLPLLLASTYSVSSSELSKSTSSAESMWAATDGLCDTLACRKDTTSCGAVLYFLVESDE
jgi:hypothetical protein